MSDVTKHSTMAKLQGDIVLVTSNDLPQLPMTIVRVIGIDDQRLLLVNRAAKKDPLEAELSQTIMDQMIPFKDPKDPRVKWKLQV